MEPLIALSRSYYLFAILLGPLAWGLVVLFRRHCSRCYDGVREVSSEEILKELDQEFIPFRQTSIRTQTEYLPFLFECIRENIDSGFEDPQVISLLERIELQKPDQERSARFSLISGGRPCDLQIRWIRDSCSRISLRIQGPPPIIRALNQHQRKIPRSVPRVTF